MKGVFAWFEGCRGIVKVSASEVLAMEIAWLMAKALEVEWTREDL